MFLNLAVALGHLDLYFGMLLEIFQDIVLATVFAKIFNEFGFNFGLVSFRVLR